MHTYIHTYIHTYVCMLQHVQAICTGPDPSNEKELPCTVSWVLEWFLEWFLECDSNRGWLFYLNRPGFAYIWSR